MSIYKKVKKKEMIRFLFGGGSAVLTDFISYKILMIYGIDRDLAKWVSFFLGSAIGFIINKYWTFESKDFHKEEIFKYVILYTCTAFINSGVNKVVLVIMPIEIIGFLFATAVSTVLNFMGQKFFVFRK